MKVNNQTKTIASYVLEKTMETYNLESSTKNYIIIL